MDQKPHTATGGALSERLVPLGAGLSAVTTLLSCLPLSVATALGAVTLSVALTPFRWWLVGLSTVFLAIGFTLLFRQPRARRRVGTIMTLSVSVVFVVLVVLAHFIRF